MASAKKQNFIVRYFKPFGLRQICDFLMLIGAVVLIVGLFTTQIVITVGLGIYIAATLLAMFRSVKVLFTKVNNQKINKRSPEYKNAIANTIIMGVIFALALFGFIWSLVA